MFRSEEVLKLRVAAGFACFTRPDLKVERIYQAEHSITRCAVAKEEDFNKQMGKDREFASTFGRKFTVPYALYRMHGFISAANAIKSGFTEDDLELLWEALLNAFEHDRSAARGEMSPRKLIVFKHDNKLGRARSAELFERVNVLAFWH